MDNLRKLAPETGIAGRYHNRETKALRNHWTEKIARDVKKFNKNLLIVFASKPTGVGDDEKINMAVAIHLGNVDAMSYRHKDFPAADWKFYRAWLILKDHKLFAPPKPKPAIEIEDEDDEVAPSASASESPVSESAEDLTTPRSLFSGKGNKRGPGPGRAKSKAIGVDIEYRNKKAKTLQDMVDIQSKRQADFAMYVSNEARAKAFQMAVLGYNTLKDTDPAGAQIYKERIIGRAAKNLFTSTGSSNGIGH